MGSSVPIWWTVAPRPTAWERWGRNAALFLLTGVSVFLSGAGYLLLDPTAEMRVGARLGIVSAVSEVLHLLDVGSGLWMAAALLAILLSHEMGHYLACRFYNVDATLPFFIPAPILNPYFGTFGALIRIRSPFPSRRALFDIGIAGPLAGFFVCLPVLYLGVREAHVVQATEGGASFALPLLFQWMTEWVRGDIPPNASLDGGPFTMAAWFGLLVTALNLIPVGQLDGGHVLYALFARRAHQLSRAIWWLCVCLILWSPSWILWVILLRVLGRNHPQTLDDDPGVGGVRIGVAVVGLLILVSCFLPSPVPGSWSLVWELLPSGIRRLFT